MRVFSIILMIVMLAGCTSTKVTKKQSMLIESGMSKQEVIGLIGLPGNRQFEVLENVKFEAWQYWNSGFFQDQYKTIWFQDEKVSGLTSYSTQSELMPEFTEIEWEDAPDIVLENRVEIQG